MAPKGEYTQNPCPYCGTMVGPAACTCNCPHLEEKHCDDCIMEMILSQKVKDPSKTFAPYDAPLDEEFDDFIDASDEELDLLDPSYV
jgi:hypothetical protein